MAQSVHRLVLTTLVIIAVMAPHFTAQPPTAEKSINKDRNNRQAAIKGGKKVATTPKWGFFGTIFHLILELYANDAVLVTGIPSEVQTLITVMKDDFMQNGLQLNSNKSKVVVFEREETKTGARMLQINDTKSAYNQVSDLVNNQFVDDNAVRKSPNTSSNGTTEAPKISRAEFLKILDRNLKGLARLRNLEWREARKDSMANLRGYTDEIFRGKKIRNRR